MPKLSELNPNDLLALHRACRKPLTPAAQAKLDIEHVLQNIAQNPDDFLSADAQEFAAMRQILNRLRKWADVDCPEF